MSINQKIEIGFADDHTLVRKTVTDLINSFENYHVRFEAPSGNDLLAQLSASAYPDIIILDIIMKDGNGYETTRNNRLHYPKIKILALSMCVEPDSALRMFKLGARGVLSKNMEPDDLRTALDRIARNEIYFPADSANSIFSDLFGDSARKEVIVNHRELKFLKYLTTDMTYKQIADEMFLSPKTLEDYKSNLCSRLRVKSRAGLVTYAIKNGLIEI